MPKLNIILLSVFLSLAIITIPVGVFASPLINVSDVMGDYHTSQLSSHQISFITPSAIDSSADTIEVLFPAGFKFTNKTIDSLSLTDGPTLGYENVESLKSSSDASHWGAVFSGPSNRLLTLTVPTDGVGAHQIIANDKIIITYDSTNSVNPSSAGPYKIKVKTSVGDNGNTIVQIVP